MALLILLLVVGLVMLIVGAESLVRGASNLGRAVGLPSLVIGLTVVAFGTSAPEFAVSVKAGLEGQSDIAVGNVIGSSLFNILFILGISALITPLVVSSQLVRLDVPVMILVSALAWIFATDGQISRVEGLILFAGIIAYTWFLIRLGKRQTLKLEANSGWPVKDKPAKPPNIWLSIGMAAVGFALLVMGSRWLVEGAVGIARALQVSELLIGLTLIAAGTSLPEVATSIIASIRGERDIAVGNVVGSNIFNILVVLGGSSAIVGSMQVSAPALHFDLPVMTAVAIACLPIFFTGGRISRWEGALFLMYYLAYTTYLILRAREADVPVLDATMIWFVLPATALGIVLSVFYALRNRRSKHMA